MDNRLWRENDIFSLDGEEVPIGDVFTDTNAKSAHFTNMGGYVFLDSGDVKYRKVTNTGQKQGDALVNPIATESATFLELVIDHGIGNGQLDGSYAYAYLPTATAQETAEYSLLPKISVVKHTDTVHAVAKPSLDALFAVFFEADSVLYGDIKISADAPCTVAVVGNTLYASDPTQTLDKFTVTVSKKNYTVDAASLSGRTAKLPLLR